MKIVNWLAYPFYHAFYGLSLKDFYELALNEGMKPNCEISTERKK